MGLFQGIWPVRRVEWKDKIEFDPRKEELRNRKVGFSSFNDTIEKACFVFSATPVSFHKIAIVGLTLAIKS